MVIAAGERKETKQTPHMDDKSIVSLSHLNHHAPNNVINLLLDMVHQFFTPLAKTSLHWYDLPII